MSDTTHPEAPSPEVGDPSAQAPNAPTVTPPSSVNGQSELGEIPEDIVNEWRWIFKGRDEGDFDKYRGKHVAVYQQKIWGSSYDPDLLGEYLTLKHQIDPERFVIVYIDRW